MATPTALTSDAGFPASDGPSRPEQQRRRGGAGPHLSSSAGRPRGPPSESLGAPSDNEGEGFADDQVPHLSRRPDPSSIPRVTDSIGLLIQEHFENFIEG